VVPNCHVVVRAGPVSSLDREGKEIAKIQLGRRDQIVHSRRLSIMAGEVEILRGPCSFTEAKIESYAAFDDPPVRCDSEETRKESIEDHHLAQPVTSRVALSGLPIDSVFHGSTKGRTVRVPHGAPSTSARSMRSRTRRLRSPAALSSRGRVVNPR
jgi:hypothetical protein